jgi:hypothetical protein
MVRGTTGGVTEISGLANTYVHGTGGTGGTGGAGGAGGLRGPGGGISGGSANWLEGVFGTGSGCALIEGVCPATGKGGFDGNTGNKGYDGETGISANIWKNGTVVS